MGVKNINKDKKRRKIFSKDIILERLIGIGESTAETLLEALMGVASIAKAMMLPYGESYRALKKLPSQETRIRVDLRSKIAFQRLLSRLIKDELIAKTKGGKFLVTPIGEAYFDAKSKNPSWGKIYSPSPLPVKKLIIIIFDIPEKERLKRDWLRYQLETMGFQRLQNSVWCGEILLPKDFMEDLEHYDILPYVHIFDVNKQGTLPRV